MPRNNPNCLFLNSKYPSTMEGISPLLLRSYKTSSVKYLSKYFSSKIVSSAQFQRSIIIFYLLLMIIHNDDLVIIWCVRVCMRAFVCVISKRAQININALCQ
jgi:hypothetical protein